MTTNTDLHGAMPELPVVAYMYEMDANNYKADKFTDAPPASMPTLTLEAKAVHELVKLSDARAAIQQAAVPEGDLIERIAQHWDGCMYDSHAEGEVDIGEAIRQNARCFAVPFIPPELDQAPPKQQPALARGEGGGVPQWQPIETAPKASKAILVYCADRKNTYTATWARDEEFPWSGKWKHFGGGFFDEVPTHWMPIPDDPAPRPSAPTGQINPDSAGQGMEVGA